MTNAYAVITGASSGIGYELVQLFAKDGVNVVLVARRKQQLNKIAAELRKEYDIDAIVLSADLSQRDDVMQLCTKITEMDLDVHYLVNNAGFGNYGMFTQSSWDKEEEMIAVNVTALTYLTKFFARLMQTQGHGKILNLGSTASFLPGPLMAVYFATKGYVLQLDAAVAEELKR